MLFSLFKTKANQRISGSAVQRADLRSIRMKRVLYPPLIPRERVGDYGPMLPKVTVDRNTISTIFCSSVAASRTKITSGE